jgi:hypothetical protein
MSNNSSMKSNASAEGSGGVSDILETLENGESATEGFIWVIVRESLI